jgi:signal transduction histidine kinase
LVRRISTWLEPVLPPEASAAILLFVLVVFFEPLQRLLGKRLRLTAQAEMDQAQRIAAAIQEVARQGNLGRLKAFVENWLKGSLELAEARLSINEIAKYAGEKSAPPDLFNTFTIQQGKQPIGVLHIRPHGAILSGETRAALEFICEQLPAAFDLCRLIEEKLRLERELAERERMAALGQMAASISHNLKNPLGSIKTILQVQIESRDLPENFRHESKMVLQEVNRLSSKLNQLLQFSRPAILGRPVEARCDAGEILREVTEVLRPEADRRGISLDRPANAEPLLAAIGNEALNDILTNLLVNALDAVSPDGHIRIGVSQSDGFCTLTVEDDGPGIPKDLQEKILQPFFTTKSQGTGLGLAIVARRVAEAKGHMDWQSPVHDGRGTRFRVRLPVAQ